MFDAVAVFNYVGDIQSMGTTLQHIDWYVDGFSYNEPYQESGPPVFTQTTGDVVYIQGSSQFDTLFHFAAVPGDSWHPAPWIGGDEYRLHVLDTGSTTIDNVSLRFLVVANAWSTDTVMERLGNLLGFMLPWMGAANNDPGGPLRCYSDDQIDHVLPWWDLDCTSVVNVPETGAEEPMIFPNPGLDHFTILLPSGPHTVTVLDATGRTVLHQRTRDNRSAINTDQLKAGIYAVRVDDGQRTLIWAKSSGQ